MKGLLLYLATLAMTILLATFWVRHLFWEAQKPR